MYKNPLQLSCRKRKVRVSFLKYNFKSTDKMGSFGVKSLGHASKEIYFSFTFFKKSNKSHFKMRQLFLRKILIKSYKYDGLIPFYESLFRCNIYLVLRIIKM